jgi:hypothetical protein
MNNTHIVPQFTLRRPDSRDATKKKKSAYTLHFYIVTQKQRRVNIKRRLLAVMGGDAFLFEFAEGRA